MTKQEVLDMPWDEANWWAARASKQRADEAKAIKAAQKKAAHKG